MKAQKEYRWNNPYEWAIDRIREAHQKEDYQEVMYMVNEMIQKLDADDIQDLFQDMMDEDGYFDPL